MNKFLKSASERFNKIKGKEFLINPISEVDAEIMTEIGQIFKKAGLVDMFQILQSYKEVKDADVLEQLMNWNLDHPLGTLLNRDAVKGAIAEVIEEQPQPPMIRIGNLVLKLYSLLGMELYERTDDEGNEKYGIIVNPTPEHAKQIPLYSNYKVEWFSDVNRNEVLDTLKSIFGGENIDFIDLEKNE